jgi:hypothetical protein|tara:strand:+ start:7942 stop:8166 length:225 start_codon:yes stop_codon:yes gene_type:complete
MNMAMWAGVALILAGGMGIWKKYRRGERYRRLKKLENPNVFIRETLPQLAPFYEIRPSDMAFPAVGVICILMSL